jgi:hypothetical protein
MSAGCDCGKGGAEGFSDGAKLAADFVGAGLDPDDGGGTGDERVQLGPSVGIEFIEHVADDEQPDGAIGWNRARDVERRELATGGFGGEVGPTRGSLSPTPDAVINNLSAQLDNALALVVKKQ